MSVFVPSSYADGLILATRRPPVMTIVLNSPERFTLPIGLNFFKGLYITKWTLIMAGSMFNTLPVLAVFIMFQRYFVKGIATAGMATANFAARAEWRTAFLVDAALLAAVLVFAAAVLPRPTARFRSGSRNSFSRKSTPSKKPGTPERNTAAKR